MLKYAIPKTPKQAMHCACSHHRAILQLDEQLPALGLHATTDAMFPTQRGRPQQLPRPIHQAG